MRIRIVLALACFFVCEENKVYSQPYSAEPDLVLYYGLKEQAIRFNLKSVTIHAYNKRHKKSRVMYKATYAPGGNLLTFFDHCFEKEKDVRTVNFIYNEAGLLAEFTHFDSYDKKSRFHYLIGYDKSDSILEVLEQWYVEGILYATDVVYPVPSTETHSSDSSGCDILCKSGNDWRSVALKDSLCRFVGRRIDLQVHGFPGTWVSSMQDVFTYGADTIVTRSHYEWNYKKKMSPVDIKLELKWTWNFEFYPNDLLKRIVVTDHHGKITGYKEYVYEFYEE